MFLKMLTSSGFASCYCITKFPRVTYILNGWWSELTQHSHSYLRESLTKWVGNEGTLFLALIATCHSLWPYPIKPTTSFSNLMTKDLT
ncbi:hypothetical protein VNO77_32985 [Canavalia gladiata]|uniref:Uncharacterized protein n=1 Tax=Canavalia gladiata TaxID=3824 RepID=A0AAN9KCZ2_CANGL